MDFDRAPSSKVDQKMSRSMRRFMEAKRLAEKLTTKTGKKRVQEKKKTVEVPVSTASGQKDKPETKTVKQRADETNEDFASRVEQQFRSVLHTNVKKGTRKNEKRTAYFDKKKTAKKASATGQGLSGEKKIDAEIKEAESKVFRNEKVAFGVSAMAPPTLSVAPRRTAMRDSAAPLLLDTTVRRKDMNESQKRQHDEKREAAIQK
ncbi:hypothetical protein SARC_14856, partial [Sphaeroforma arctica JP610]